ncbi:MAG TPA: hypothetical protein VIK18_02960 [Pirellulales bacterium]
MQSDSKTIFEAALKLPENERLILVSRLLESMPEEPAGLSLDDPELLNELRRRSADTQGAVPWSQVRAEL